MIRRSY